MSTLFIADLHLSPDAPETLAHFYDLLSHTKNKLDALYILGDFFEMYLGDGLREDWQDDITAALNAFSRHTPVFIMRGNRDFLMGEAFMQAANASLLPDPTVIDLYDTPTLLTHGDLLCTDDIAYLKLRRIIRQPWLIKGFNLLPTRLKQIIAKHLRTGSKRHTQHTPLAIMDVNQTAVVEMLRTHKVNHMIHGHTHRPAQHEFEHTNQRCTRHVLGAWHGKNARVLLVKRDSPPALIPLIPF